MENIVANNSNNSILVQIETPTVEAEVKEIFKQAQNKRGYLPNFYKLQEQETGEIYE